LDNLKEGKKIDTAKLLDPEVVLHPQISKWRDAITVDLKLLNSLKDGQIQDTVFRSKDGKYELLAGARRYFHQKLLGTSWEDIPKKILDDVSDSRALMLAASENIFRKDFNPWEEARAIVSLTTGGFKPKDLAKQFGKSEGYIRSRMALMQLPEKIRDRFEKKDIPIGYAEPVKKLDKYEEAQKKLLEKIVEGMSNRYSGIDTIEEADAFVTTILKQIKDKEELLVKYGPCPKCNSKSIGEGWQNDQLKCGDCNYSWHKETKEPWEYYETKQKLQEMGIKVEEGPETLKLTPRDVASMVTQKAEEQERLTREEGETLPANFRSKATLLMLLEPMITGDNIQKLEVRDERIEIQLIEGFDVYFNGLRKDYADGVSKARIETSGYSSDSTKKIHEWVNQYTPDASDK